MACTLHPRLRLAACLLVCAAGTPFSAADTAPAKAPLPKLLEIKVTPSTLTLDGPRDVRRIIVSGKTENGTWLDVTRDVGRVFTDQAVRVDNTLTFRPVQDAETRVILEVGGRDVSLPVTVKNQSRPQPVSFVRDIGPILSRVGCNAGTCHGAAKGKNGFKLSLRGYDLDYDYEALVDDLAGRRFNRAAPDDSLMLLKPIQSVPHEGGYVLDPESDHYKLIRQWITEGVTSDVATTRRVERLEVFPSRIDLYKAGAAQQALVIAHYPDGATRDVSRDAVYGTSSMDTVSVSPDGLVTALRRGEASLLVRYEGVFATSPITVFGERPGYAWKPVPEYNYIDKYVYTKLQRVQLLPSDLCTDAEFIRRVYIDLTGVPPAPEVTRAFLDDKTETRAKREQVVDRLIGSPQFTDHWTHKLCDLLQCNRKYLGEKGVYDFYNWVRQSVAENRPYDQFVHELLTAAGSTAEHPAANYFRVANEPSAAVENVTQLFLGTRFNCNKCHDHPFEKWTQNQYYSLSAYFARVGMKAGRVPGEEIVFDRRDGGEVTHPKSGKVMAPEFPYTIATKLPPEPTRRQSLADWMTAPENPLFAKSTANRVWSYLLGRGIIDPVDDIRSGNPASNPELLDALTKDFVEHKFDLRYLIRTIATSRTYQHGLKKNEWNKDDGINFARAVPRRLTAEQLLDAISQATGTPQKYPGFPAGTWAMQLPDTQVANEFLDTFGRPPRESPCECERSSDVSLGQTMKMVNGPTINDAIRAPGGRAAKLAETIKDDKKLVEELYLAARCRLPTPSETEKGVKYLTSAQSRLEGAQDIMWAMVNSQSFLFNY